MNNIILLTGSNGFVGKNLYSKLIIKYNITSVTRNVNSVNQINWNGLSNLKKSFKVYIHLAGKAHDLKNTSNDEEYYYANTELTKKLFDHFLSNKSSIFIYISSVKAAADKVEGVLTEEIKENPKTVYGKSKLLAEEYLLSKKLPENKKLYILRPCMIYGEGNKGNLNLLFKLVNYRLPYPLGEFENKRSFLSVDNLCFIIEKLIEKKPISGVYNVADDVAISTLELIKIIGKGLDKKPIVLKIPKTIIYRLGNLGSLLRLKFNNSTIEKLSDNYVVSNEKILKKLNVKMPINIKEGLLKTIKTFKDV